MHRKCFKFVSIVLTAAVALSLAGCLSVPDYSLSSTGDSNAAPTMPSTSQTAYVRFSFDINKNPYFAMLSETEMNAYSFIYEGLIAGNSEIECPIRLEADQLSKAMDAVLNDHPEIFWIDNNYSYSYNPEDGSIKEITFTFYDFADTPEKLQAAKAEFDAAASSIIAGASEYQTLIDIELYIHDYICENTVYDESAPYHQSAYSTIVLHRSVCAGYARSFQYLMQRAGATCYYVTGSTEKTVEGSGDSGSHSWNMVLINGDFYNVDCLWDDTASDSYGSPIYPFFNIPDSEMVNHVRIQMALGLPSCTATECRYSNQFGPTIEADSIVFADDE